MESGTLVHVWQVCNRWKSSAFQDLAAPFTTYLGPGSRVSTFPCCFLAKELRICIWIAGLSGVEVRMVRPESEHNHSKSCLLRHYYNGNLHCISIRSFRHSKAAKSLKHYYEIHTWRKEPFYNLALMLLQFCKT